MSSPSPIQLRFEWPAGQATFEIPRKDALKIVVALRSLGLGLSLKEGATNIIITKQTAQFLNAERIIKKLRRSA